MDEFGVLVESIGFRAAHGKAAPMAKPKPKPNSHFPAHTATPSFNDSYSLPVDQLDGIFRSNVNITNTRQSQNQNNFVDDDVFGVSGSNQFEGIDFESVLSGSNNSNDRSSNSGLRDFGVGDDLLGTNSKRNDDRVDDLLGGAVLNSSGNREEKGAGLDDLLSGFGGAGSAKNTTVHSETNLFPESNGRPSNLSSTADDPFLVFESSVSQSDSSWSFTGASDQGIGKGSHQSTIDDFDGFVTGGAPKADGIKTTTNKSSSKQFENADYLDDIFGGANAAQQNKSNNTARSSSMAQNSLFGDFFHGEKEPEVKLAPPRPTSSSKKASFATNVGADFTSLFGDVTSSSGEFHEIEGEPAERRRARLKRHIEMNERMAKALDEKNQRDLQIQHEQEEKRRLAETLDSDIKRWAAGKEGNLRALLSSLQQVLWPECGWRPVSLTDMITSDSVKKVYMKSNLYVHPDKVQQKGANLQQKYVAEKVFDILKEAWNKFSAEELR